MKGKNELTNEDKRQLCLDFVSELVKAGKDGLPKLELINKVIEINNGKYLVDVYERIFDNEYINAIGKNIARKGSRRWTRYVIDDQSSAESLINDYFDSRMNELDRWKLYRDICEFISECENGVALDNDIADQFSIELERLDEMNSKLSEFGVGLDYFNENSHGTKVRLNENTLGIILTRIEELKEEENKQLRELKRKNLEKARNSKKCKDEIDLRNKVQLSPEERKKIQLRLVEVLYSNENSGMRLGSIPSAYHQKVGTSIQQKSVESMLKGIPGIKLHKDYYSVTNIKSALMHLDPLRSKVRIEVGMKKDVKVEYTNMRFSRELGEYNIYILEDDNTYDLYSQILDLMLMGASIDKEVTDKVYKSVMSNMTRGMKSIL